MLQLKLKELREIKGISQRELADILDVSRGSVGNWESGTREPNLATVKKIADYFGITTDYLIGVNEKQSNSLFNIGNRDCAVLDEIKNLSELQKEEVLDFIKFIKNKK